MVGFHKGPMGFQIDFENGWTVSVQFGIGNYCGNRDTKGNPFMDMPDFLECNTAEIAAWPTNVRGEGKGTSTKEWYSFENGDQVDGWQTPDKVLEFMNMIAKLGGGEYLSECCDAIPIGELDAKDGDYYRSGFCNRCKDNAVFTKELV